MSEYTSLEVSKRLAEAGFKETADTVLGGHCQWKRDEDDPIYVAYRADTLLTWLMTKPFFSRRAATVQIAYRAVNVGKALDPIADTSVRQDERWVGHYFVTALNGSGHEVGQGESASRSDALAEVVMKVMEMKP